jgi:hypothetical protein
VCANISILRRVLCHKVCEGGKYGLEFCAEWDVIGEGSVTSFALAVCVEVSCQNDDEEK